MGVVVSMSLLLVAFEWNTEMRKPIMRDYLYTTEVIELDLITRMPEPPKPRVEEPQFASPDELIATDEEVDAVQMDTADDTPGRAVFIPTVPQPPQGNVEQPVDMPLEFAEISPMFEGGQAALLKFLGQQIRYPVVDIEQGVEGRVICTFVVEKDGSITDIQVLRGVSPSIDKEAVRVVSAMPKWKPGYQNGNPVRVKFTLPIVFRISK